MRVAIVGTGYVGLVTGACLASIGHDVTCVDRLPDRVDMLNNGQAPFYEPGLSDLVARLTRAGKLKASGDIRSAVRSAEISIIAVGTPDKDGQIDLSQVAAAAADIGSALKASSDYHVVTVKSTVVPGTTDRIVRESVEAASGKKVGLDFGLCMNPETLREGSAIDDFMAADRILIGQYDDRSGAVLMELYKQFDCPKLQLSLRNAEFVKYASNLLLATMVSYSNEIAAMCESMPGTDVDIVMDGVHLDRRLTPVLEGRRVSPGILSYLRAGAGFGGSCLPKDVNALRDFANARGVASPVLDAVVAVNRSRPAYVASLAETLIGSITGKRIAVLGLAFKAGTDDLRDSPALALIRVLLKRGANVVTYDPMCMDGARRIFGKSVAFAEDAGSALVGADLAIMATAWPDFLDLDWDKVAGNMSSPILIDGRNAFRNRPKPSGIRYYAIGRNYASPSA